jgi:hypothetical protein
VADVTVNANTDAANEILRLSHTTVYSTGSFRDLTPSEAYVDELGPGGRDERPQSHIAQAQQFLPRSGFARSELCQQGHKSKVQRGVVLDYHAALHMRFTNS